MAQETTSRGCPWGNHQGPTGAKVQLLQPVLLVVLFACANFLGESLGAISLVTSGWGLPEMNISCNMVETYETSLNQGYERS